MKKKLNKTTLDRECLPPAPGEVNKNGNPIRQKVYWDTELPGFGVVVSEKCKTFVVQRPVRGKTVRVTIGRYGVYTLDQARDKGRKLLQEMREGINPNERRRQQEEAEKAEKRRQEWQRFTLRQAMEEHIKNIESEDCSPRTVETIRYEMDRYLGDWLDRPLAEITRAECLDRHRHVTEAHGGTSANRVMRTLRACWNSAQARYAELPNNPIARNGNGRRFPWNRTRRKRQPIPWADLPAWADRVDALENPIRRDWQWFVLLTGLRSEDARTIRWEHVNFEAGTLHRPKPKGGEDRAFTVPLSGHVLAILKRRKANNPVEFGYDDRGWVWPTWSRDGRVVHMQNPTQSEYYEDEDGNKRKRAVLPSPHRLRDTFASAANEAGVDLLTIKVLMNHVLSESDVTEGYIRPSEEHLRQVQESITAFLLDKANRKPEVVQEAAS